MQKSKSKSRYQIEGHRLRDALLPGFEIFSGSDKKEVPVVVVLQVFATPLHVVADVQESDVFKFLPENVQLCSTTSILHNH